MKWREVRVLPFAAVLIVILLYRIDTDPGYNEAWKTVKECIAVTFFVLQILLITYMIFCGLRYLVKKLFFT
jgi:hypothetical protein